VVIVSLQQRKRFAHDLIQRFVRKVTDEFNAPSRPIETLDLIAHATPRTDSPVGSIVSNG
jgi:hypothetical protein